MNFYEKVLVVLEKLIAEPSLLIFLVSMCVVAFALFVVYHAIKVRK